MFSVHNFPEEKDLTKLITILNQSDDDHLVFWFSGEKGPRLDGLNTYKKRLFSYLYKHHLFLYEMYAWNALYPDKLGEISKSHSCHDQIEGLTKNFLNQNNFSEQDGSYEASSSDNIHPNQEILNSDQILNSFLSSHLHSITAADFFIWLKLNLKNLSEILSRPELLEVSRNRQDNGVNIQTVFDEYPLSLDTAKVYSALQYVELLWIAGTYHKNYEITFVLPNDEAKYYHNGEQIIEDIKYLFGYVVNVKIYNFKYGTKISSRPYIGGSGFEKELTVESFYNTNIVRGEMNRKKKDK